MEIGAGEDEHCKRNGRHFENEKEMNGEQNKRANPRNKTKTKKKERKIKDKQ